MLTVENLTVRYGRKKVVDQVSFSVPENSVTALIGLNGSGKTSIMNAMVGLLNNATGKVLVDGESWSEKSLEKVTLVPDHLAMVPGQRVEEALEMMDTFYSNYNPERAESLLEFFKLNKKDVISHLSKGNQMKLNMLMSLSLDFQYLLMDEPFSGIDIFSKEELLNVFTSDILQGRGVLLTTHAIEEVEQLADRVILLKNGSIVRAFDVEEVREQENKSITDVMREVYQG
ncbi:ABC transporter ATP-binding protein [Atopobacter sp. AH10]|uniref:ABC transporter ATP-binding protein n=1 Tax=Atopobacter sp. AH10 TaxID=2315861 RepID=UPI000EF217AA|nr:ABC transporter ATP-binding protein [Atopobacter sp. AH10]RLK63657.1 ABC transporter ATP-binding protein [Atopobacter sp. AH10]